MAAAARTAAGGRAARIAAAPARARRARAPHARRAAPPAAGGEQQQQEQEQEEDLPPWARDEAGGGGGSAGLPQLPYGVYLLVSCWFLIAATGTVFEYIYKEPIFGVLEATSFLYTPACAVLFTGASFGAVKFWGTATKLANEENERDGYGQ
eukprot:PRCOL_00002065-RA